MEGAAVTGAPTAATAHHHHHHHHHQPAHHHSNHHHHQGSATATATHHQQTSHLPSRLPPMAGVKRTAVSAWDTPPTMSVANAVAAAATACAGSGNTPPPAPPPGSHPGAPQPPQPPSHATNLPLMHSVEASVRAHKMPLDESAQFTAAAEQGARAQREADNSRGQGIFETYELGIAIVKSSKLYANQRRSNRQLPGGSDSTTAACYMLGGTPDSMLSPLVARVSPCDPREERCKAVERVLKDKTRGAICALNGENPREARADNLAAVRICEVVADILVAYAAKRLLDTLQDLYKSNAMKDSTIRELRDQLDASKRRRIDISDLRGMPSSRCWCGGREPPNMAAAAAAAAALPPNDAVSGIPGVNVNAAAMNMNTALATTRDASETCYSYPTTGRDMAAIGTQQQQQLGGLTSRQLPPPPSLQDSARSLPGSALMSSTGLPMSAGMNMGGTTVAAAASAGLDMGSNVSAGINLGLRTNGHGQSQGNQQTQVQAQQLARSGFASPISSSQQHWQNTRHNSNS